MSSKKSKSNQHRSRYLWMALTVLSVVAMYVVLKGGEPARGSSLTPGLTAETGASAAPEFRLKDIDGRAVSLSDFRGKVVILDFWATWCPPCRREIPDLISLQTQYKARGLQIVGVALDEPDKVKGFAQYTGMNYPVLLGNDDVSALYGGISGIPTTFIIDRNGKIAERFIGFTERSVFEAGIKNLF